jgi:hypothetical protein
MHLQGVRRRRVGGDIPKDAASALQNRGAYRCISAPKSRLGYQKGRFPFWGKARRAVRTPALHLCYGSIFTNCGCKLWRAFC